MDWSLLSDYWQGLLEMPQLIRRFAFKPRTLEDERQEALLRGALPKTFNGPSLLLMGIGYVIGNGAYGTNGSTAAAEVGPALFVSYALAGLASLCAAACYGELALDMPIAGGPFTYVMVTFGELPAWLTLCGLLLQYIFLTALMAQLIGVQIVHLCGNACTIQGEAPGCLPRADFDRFVVGGTDVVALGGVVLLTLLLAFGMRESAVVLNVLAVVKLVLLTIITAAGFVRTDASNMKDFLPRGSTGLFQAMSVLFYSYLGWDTITMAAEEVQRPAHMPWAMVLTVVIAGVYYILTSLGLVLMVPYSVMVPQGDCAIGLLGGVQQGSAAFTYVGMGWAAYVSFVANLLGIISSLVVSLFTVSRLVMVASRDWLLPPPLAQISPRTRTPVWATLVVGLVVGIIALLVDSGIIMSMASFAQLLVLFAVVNTELYRRYYPEFKLRFTSWGGIETVESRANSQRQLGLQRGIGSCSFASMASLASSKVQGGKTALGVGSKASSDEEGSGLFGVLWGRPALGDSLPIWAQKVLALAHMGAISAASVVLSATFTTAVGQAATLAVLGVWFAATTSMWLLCPLQYEPSGWRIPAWMLPWVPSVAILLICFSMAQLGEAAGDGALYLYTGAFFLGALVLFFLFSLPMSYIRQLRDVGGAAAAEELTVEELVFQHGQWVPKRGRGAVPGITPRLSSRTSSGGIYLTSAAASVLSGPALTPAPSASKSAAGPQPPAPAAATLTRTSSSPRPPVAATSPAASSGAQRAEAGQPRAEHGAPVLLRHQSSGFGRLAPVQEDRVLSATGLLPPV